MADQEWGEDPQDLVNFLSFCVPLEHLEKLPPEALKAMAAYMRLHRDHLLFALGGVRYGQIADEFGQWQWRFKGRTD